MEKSSQKLIYGPSNTHCRSTREESSFIIVAVKENKSRVKARIKLKKIGQSKATTKTIKK